MGGLLRRASVDLGALRRNLQARVPDGERSLAVADLRANAYGHGLVPVAHALTRAGLAGFLVSGPEAAERLASEGIGPVFTSRPPAGHRLVGAALYGVGGEPVLRLSAGIVNVKRVDAGHGVSYGYTYRTRSETTLVLATLGFADGLPRSAANRAPVTVGGAAHTVTGRVAMDQFVVDVGDDPAEVGGEAVLVGAPERGEPALEAWAAAAGLDPLAFTARLGPRIERIYP